MHVIFTRPKAISCGRLLSSSTRVACVPADAKTSQKEAGYDKGSRDVGQFHKFLNQSVY